LQIHAAAASARPISMTQQMTGRGMTESRRGLRRTVGILVAVATMFYLLSFVQILLIK
jgi:hypothetical protein